MFKRKEAMRQIRLHLRMMADTDWNAALLLAQFYDAHNAVFWYNRAIDLGSIKAVKLLSDKCIEDRDGEIDFAETYDVLLRGIDLRIAKMTIEEKNKIVREYLKVQALQNLLE